MSGSSEKEASALLLPWAYVRYHHRSKSSKAILHSPAWSKLATRICTVDLIQRLLSVTNKVLICQVALQTQSLPTCNKLAFQYRQMNAFNRRYAAVVLQLPFARSASTTTLDFKIMLGEVFMFSTLSSSIPGLAARPTISSRHTPQIGCTNPQLSSRLRCIELGQLILTSVHTICCASLCCRFVNIGISYIQVGCLLDDRGTPICYEIRAAHKYIHLKLIRLQVSWKPQLNDLASGTSLCIHLTCKQNKTILQPLS